VEAILKRKKEIEEAGLRWSVVESVPVHEDIKRHTGVYEEYIERYKTTLKNLGECGIDTVCYNFMPVLDWTRTTLNFSLDDGAIALKFDALALAAFDMFMLNRPGSREEYDDALQLAAEKHFQEMSQDEKSTLTETILAGLPGSVDDYGIDEFRIMLDSYKHIDGPTLTKHLHYFLEEVIPVAEASGIRMCIHPDDPPFPLFGLPRVVSTESDIHALYRAVDSPNNGLTFCTGSFGVREDNDLPGMIDRLGDRIHFVHLRTTRRDADGNFYEAPHLQGDVDMPAVMKALIVEQQKRVEAGREDPRMPFRPDHGHILLDDQSKPTYPGYSLIGRMRGLAELRGLEKGIRSIMSESR
jgi:mannonate dehydratase